MQLSSELQTPPQGRGRRLVAPRPWALPLEKASTRHTAPGARSGAGARAERLGLRGRTCGWEPEPPQRRCGAEERCRSPPLRVSARVLWSSRPSQLVFPPCEVRGRRTAPPPRGSLSARLVPAPLLVPPSQPRANLSRGDFSGVFPSPLRLQDGVLDDLSPGGAGVWDAVPSLCFL